MNKILTLSLIGINLSTNGATMARITLLSLLGLAACTNPDSNAGGDGSGDNSNGDVVVTIEDGSDTDTNVAATPSCNELSILPGAINFGEVKIGENSAQYLTVANDSDEGCDSLELTIMVAGDAQFSADVSSLSLTPGSTGSVWVTFTPDSISAFTASVNLSSSSVSASVPVEGLGFDTERCDGIDNDGDGVIDNGTVDTDGDGVCDARDSCPDDSTNDVDGDGVCGADDICDGYDDSADTDGDGTPDGCDVEECDEIDNDGDGVIDNGFDQDGDGSYWCIHGAVLADCDDADASVYPGATETWYDGIDQACDGGSDYDQDGDGYDSIDYSGTDCNDADANTYPGADDPADDGIDQNCDDSESDTGTVDTGGVCASEFVSVTVDAGSGQCADGNGALVVSPGTAGTFLDCEQTWYVACNATDGSASIVAATGTFTADGCAEALATNPSWDPAATTCGWLSQ